jgi:hypothetical protein
MNKTAKPNHRPDSAALQVGYVVALALREPCANNRCFVGQVEAVDDLGVRLTLVDWITGMMAGNDFFAPWDNIVGALVATPAHNKELFGRTAASFQTRHNQQPGAETEEDSGI